MKLTACISHVLAHKQLNTYRISFPAVSRNRCIDSRINNSVHTSPARLGSAVICACGTGRNVSQLIIDLYFGVSQIFSHDFLSLLYVKHDGISYPWNRDLREKPVAVQLV